MAQNPNRLMDKTHLSIDQAERRGFIHRDYIAHCFRWSHVVKHLMQRHRYKGAHIIDVGCGKDQPLPRLLYSNKMTGFKYTGVDINRLDLDDTLIKAHENGKIEAAVFEQTDASQLEPEQLTHGLGDFLVCFEVLEHVHPSICGRMIRQFTRLVKPGGTLFVSTPVYNGSAAGNHINEMSRRTLAAAFEFWGLKIVGNWGTFASQSDIEPALSAEEREVWRRLKEYYDSNVLSTIFAPNHPGSSRNNFWLLENTPVDDGHWYLEEPNAQLRAVLDDCLNQSADIARLFDPHD